LKVTFKEHKCPVTQKLCTVLKTPASQPQLKVPPPPPPPPAGLGLGQPSLLSNRPMRKHAHTWSWKVLMEMFIYYKRVSLHR
jgi:hypothetical protein